MESWMSLQCLHRCVMSSCTMTPNSQLLLVLCAIIAGVALHSLLRLRLRAAVRCAVSSATAAVLLAAKLAATSTLQILVMAERLRNGAEAVITAAATASMILVAKLIMLVMEMAWQVLGFPLRRFLIWWDKHISHDEQGAVLFHQIMYIERDILDCEDLIGQMRTENARLRASLSTFDKTESEVFLFTDELSILNERKVQLEQRKRTMDALNIKTGWQESLMFRRLREIKSDVSYY